MNNHIYYQISLKNVGLKIGEYLNFYNSKKVLIIHGHRSFDAFRDVLLKAIPQGLTQVGISGFSLYPKLTDIVRVNKIIQNDEIDTIIAIGGGTVIDIAKSASILWKYDEGEILQMLDVDLDNIPFSKLNMILIPTTCGTGAEITPFSVVYHGTSKYSFYGESLIPQRIIHCPALSESLSTEQIVIGAFDTLSQSIESIWSRASVHASRLYASEAIRLVLENIEAATRMSNKNARGKLMEAGFLSGKAISMTKTTGPHALSYPLTMKYGIPHGLAVMITLPFFFLHHEKVVQSPMECHEELKKNLAYILKLMNVETSLGAFEFLNSLADKFNTDISLSTYINAADLNVLNDYNFNESRLKNHPVLLTKSDISNIFYQSFVKASTI